MFALTQGGALARQLIIFLVIQSPSSSMRPREIVSSNSSLDVLFAEVADAGPGAELRVTGVTGLNKDAIRLRMLTAGLVDVGVPSAATDVLVGVVPNHDLGAKSSLAWTKVAANDAVTPAELVDEDELLARDGLQDSLQERAEGESARKGCGVDGGGKRKPCKDCTCGLADMNDDAPAAPVQQPGKGCGSCALGDAFRCASCPYLGLPPFNPGEKVEVPSSLMTSDI